MREQSFEFYSIAFLGIILCRYFVVAGITYWFFYSPVSQSFINHRLRHRVPSWPAIRHDIKLSALSALVFALAAGFVLSAYQDGATHLYTDPREYGLWYLGASYSAVLVLQDTYFYFTHRLFHHPKLFPWLHRGHHRSRYPTPWTSFAFDPLEAAVQALFLVGIVFVLPLHFITVIAVLTTMTVWAVLNHLGPDRLPALFPHHWLGEWVIGPAHHSIHHLKYAVHYGLYFTFWDRLLGTQDPNYTQNLSDFRLGRSDSV
ncbi:sterol desaturase family protein [Phormidium tenue]|uniref:Sterol C5-desaturase n=1 Tax=Phormidium tenue NIES-30 TaxID=549789 RepID=A0A1U7J885_9CYAN|nr:sterol desaturase family protein [Phormidium tenue]MBD2231297.1 sterol desaturase family protein [Phormidium tenue FACHB-1052]OKH49539.1 sterol C5-desaturase [Phormidium tenue NIES-30]